jgi:squalene-hopene/tetraprenyl-beta-curcumene cyclase
MVRSNLAKSFRRSVQRAWIVGAIFAIGLCAVSGFRAVGAEGSKHIGPDPTTYRKTVDRAIDYLEQAQGEDGSYSKQAGVGVTALVATGLIRNGRTPADPLVARSLKFIESQVRDDGGIYTEGSRHRIYDTCLAIQCLVAANKDGRFNDALKRAEQYVKGLQWDETEGIDESNANYGGAGYGENNNRPDLSNTSFLVDALHSAGSDSNDPALKKALVFVSRCQNLESIYNTMPPAAKVNDGGFYYTVAAGGSSPAGTTDDGGLRSYGSMTYAGLKSMIFAGVKQDDPRVRAAHHWIEQNYTVAENPGMGASGLFYYYHTFAKALDAAGDDYVADKDGNLHDWRRDVAEQLASTQKADGSWVNSAKRWLEGDPNLVTAYSLMTLSYCQPRTIARP